MDREVWITLLFLDRLGIRCPVSTIWLVFRRLSLFLNPTILFGYFRYCFLRFSCGTRNSVTYYVAAHVILPPLPRHFESGNISLLILFVVGCHSILIFFLLTLFYFSFHFWEVCFRILVLFLIISFDSCDYNWSSPTLSYRLTMSCTVVRLSNGQWFDSTGEN